MPLDAAEINQLWDDLEHFLAENAPYVFETLNPGASASSLAAFEQLSGLSLPADYRTSLARHDGDAYLYSYCYLTLKAMQHNWEMMNRLTAEGVFASRAVDTETGVIQNVWWHAAWIPFAEDGGGNYICIDLAPGPNGQVGQIIYHERAEGPFESEFKSFSDWLKDYWDGLSAGKFVVNRDGGIDEA